MTAYFRKREGRASLPPFQGFKFAPNLGAILIARIRFKFDDFNARRLYYITWQEQQYSDIIE
jgi:hypothetical protein